MLRFLLCFYSAGCVISGSLVWPGAISVQAVIRGPPVVYDSRLRFGFGTWSYGLFDLYGLIPILIRFVYTV